MLNSTIHNTAKRRVTLQLLTLERNPTLRELRFAENPPQMFCTDLTFSVCREQIESSPDKFFIQKHSGCQLIVSLIRLCASVAVASLFDL